MAIANLLQRATASVRKVFYDNFAGRANTTGSLGTAIDGSKWTAVSGTLNVNSGVAKATATTTPLVGSSYPIAAVTMPTSNSIIRISDTGNGASAALWVQSSSDWWMVSLDSTFNTIPATTNYTSGALQYTASNTSYTSGSPVAGNTYTSGFVTTYTTVYSRSTYNIPYYGFLTKTTYRVAGYSGSNFNYTAGMSSGSAAVFTQGTTTPYTSSNSPYSSGNPYTTAANSTSYAYQAVLKINRSINNSVSTLSAGIVSTSQTIKSLIVVTAGNQITARAYSDANFVTQIGSNLVYTATGAVVNTTYGISISPTQYAQSDTIGASFRINRGA